MKITPHVGRKFGVCEHRTSPGVTPVSRIYYFDGPKKVSRSRGDVVEVYGFIACYECVAEYDDFKKIPIGGLILFGGTAENRN